MKEPIPDVWEGLPVVGAAGMREVDLAATEKRGLKALDLMENAGKAVAAECAVFLAEKGLSLEQAKLVVCCGRGANGGDGLVAARYLAEGGATVAAFLCPPKNDGAGKYPELVSVNLARAQAAGVTVTSAGPQKGLEKALAWCHLVIDALLGTGATGKPAGAIHHMIREITAAKKPVVAVDIPSGIHPDTGYHSGVYVVADMTLTLGLAKRGLLAPHAKAAVGVLKVLDIGYPAALLRAAK
ncbi:MAG: NAD(P)H-hydrate epimerase [Elusimicrobiota bacterium]|nr:NAD(P)H-hydrate epimerase [Elusimicrobiota bacterium]